MTDRGAERLASYLRLITRNVDADRVLEAVPRDAGYGTARAGPGLEAGPDLAAQARRGLESVLSGAEPPADAMFGMEALVIPELRPAVDVQDGSFHVTHRLWTHLNEAPARTRLEAAIPSVGRIELPGHPDLPFGGTGFVVGDGLVMTNRHVAAIFATGLGDRRLGFRPGHRAGIDLGRERERPAGRTLTVVRVVMIHPYWDMAILAVEGLDRAVRPLRLAVEDAGAADGREIAVIGYPAFDPRNNPDEQNDLFDRAYGVKRLQPGQLHGRVDTESYGKIVAAAGHDCSTLGGNSGSAVIDIASGDVLALHFGGRYRSMNYAVPAWELARDGRVVDAGVAFAGAAGGGVPPWQDWWARADAAEAPDATPAAAAAQSPPAARPAAGAVAVAAPPGADGTVSIEIPLQITVRLGRAVELRAAAAPAREAVAAGGGLEALVEPWRDTDYGSRTGYDADFLGVRVPMPDARDPRDLAPTRQGGTVLHYQNFSIRMHAKRRLALVAAANVTADPRLKTPERGRDYGRRALTGLDENDREKWFLDPRLDDTYQLPDAFFTKDRQAFDKGHIVRREDVAWGATYALLRRANGDSYHATNCSPQTSAFNQSSRGVENWGDLENRVLAGAARERLCVFAGPVLDPGDTVFHGVGDRGRVIRAKIPARFWKVVVAPTADGLAAFGFVLEQDLSDVAFEYVVSEEFVPHMYPIAEIAEATGVVFPDVVLEADEYDTVTGRELAMATGLRRRRR